MYRQYYNKINNKIVIILSIVFLIVFLSLNFNSYFCYGDSLSDSIDEQLNNIDFDELENLFNEEEFKINDFDFYSFIKKTINGELSFSFSDFFKNILSLALESISSFLPGLISIMIISIFVSSIIGINGGTFSKEIEKIVLFACYSFIILILFNHFIVLYNNSRKILKLLNKSCEIMSPIILSLMIASSGNVSAGIYKPITVFLTSGIGVVFTNYVMPIILVIAFINILSGISTEINLKNIGDFLGDILKWTFGIISFVFSIILTVQGIATSVSDGISFKITRYALANSIPIVGSVIKDSFDLIIAGSILIKNSIGFGCIIAIFYLIVSPVITLIIYSLCLKLVGSFISIFNDNSISKTCISLSKTMGYLIATLVIFSLLFFILIVLMMLSANNFV